MLIFVPQLTPRVSYTFDFIFQTILGLSIDYTSDPEFFACSEKAKINYSSNNFSQALFLKANPILFENNIRIHELDEVTFQENRLLFKSSDDSFLPFDPFACTFYFISRYEEYLPFQPDEHNRFPDAANCLVRLNLHQKPIVDQMAIWIADKLCLSFPELKITKRRFNFLTTIDVDNAWAFQNKGFSRSVGAALKAALHGNLTELKQRVKVFSGKTNDPYDNYDELFEQYSAHPDLLIFFFLMGDRNRFDKSISHKNQNFRNLIKRISEIFEVGIHPSYASNGNRDFPEIEIMRLSEISGKTITKSRQHYLKLNFPETYQNLVAMGITNDYSMGFSALAGFRAGTCTPFPFFDLSSDRGTELIIHPFQVMDVALKNNLKLNPEQAMNLIEKLMHEVKQVNGTFVSLWHNETIGDTGLWKGWREVFRHVRLTGINLTDEPI